MPYIIKHDEEKCIVCGACVAVCDNFVMEGDKVKVVKEKVDELGCNEEAANVCPTQAITIEEVNE